MINQEWEKETGVENVGCTGLEPVTLTLST